MLLEHAAAGRFPDADGEIEVVGSPGGVADVLMAFTGHFVLAADIDPDAVLVRVPEGDLAAPTAPAFVSWVAQRIGSYPASHDALFVARAAPGDPLVGLRPVTDLDHPRVARAHRYRTDVRAFTTTDDTGLLVLGRGLLQRWEMGIEVVPEARSAGLGGRLADAARRLLPPGTPIWAQVAPGNAASLRAVTTGGFRAVGAEVLFPRSAP